MNKKLLSLAIAGVLAGMGTAAQADVTVYGKGHVSWDYAKSDANTTATSANPDKQSYVSDNSSRIGVKVSEDLGGGLKALAQWEIAARTDNSTTLSANRNSFLGLQSDVAGTVMLGKYDSPFKEVSRMVDLFNERVGDSRNVLGVNSTTAVPSSSTAFDRRTANMVRYVTPSFGGLTVAGQYSGGESVTNTSVSSVNAMWAGAGAKVGLAYETHGTGAAGVGTSSTESGIRLAGSYTVSGFTIAALYETLADLGGVSGADRDSYGLGGQYAMGKHVIKAQYYVADKVKDTTDTGGSLWAVGYDYNFTKNTTWYVAYAQASNDANVRNFAPAGANGGHGDALALANSNANNGVSPSAFSTGMEIKF
jgi:predicted porin